MIHLRVNALPTRARLARGRPNLSSLCRFGCEHAETIAHLGLCPSVSSNVSKRHDDVVDRLARYLHQAGSTVAKEVSFLQGSGGSRVGSLRPDLLVTRGTTATILDVQIVGPSRNLEQAAALKKQKYDCALIKRQLALRGLTVDSVTGIIINTSGVWLKSSVTSLLSLGLSKSKIKNLTCQVLQGTLRVWRGYQGLKGTTRGLS